MKEKLLNWFKLAVKQIQFCIEDASSFKFLMFVVGVYSFGIFLYLLGTNK